MKIGPTSPNCLTSGDYDYQSQYCQKRLPMCICSTKSAPWGANAVGEEHPQKVAHVEYMKRERIWSLKEWKNDFR